jgi:hypothetical protein
MQSRADLPLGVPGSAAQGVFMVRFAAMHHRCSRRARKTGPISFHPLAHLGHETWLALWVSVLPHAVTSISRGLSSSTIGPQRAARIADRPAPPCMSDRPIAATDFRRAITVAAAAVFWLSAVPRLTLANGPRPTI